MGALELRLPSAFTAIECRARRSCARAARKAPARPLVPAAATRRNRPESSKKHSAGNRRNALAAAVEERHSDRIRTQPLDPPFDPIRENPLEVAPCTQVSLLDLGGDGAG